MKRIISLLLVLLFISCDTNVNDVEQLKYSKEDLKPLGVSDQAEYYKDAALIELGELAKDSTKRLNQVELNQDSILSYYTDLINIYNNSYKISNSFFEYATSLHSYSSSTLFSISVLVDANKPWISNWNNGITFTGYDGIDTIIANYHLGIEQMTESNDGYYYVIKSKLPINYSALIEKFKRTEQFLLIEPAVLIGWGNNISLKIENNAKYYRYDYGWGDCPSGCLYGHYWIVKLIGNEAKLFEEDGDELN